MVEHLFSGNGVCLLTQGGKLIVPRFVLKSLGHSPIPHSLLLGCHEGDPCLIAYPKAHQASLYADMERRRMIEEMAAPHAHHERARKMFGYVEEVEIGSD